MQPVDEKLSTMTAHNLKKVAIDTSLASLFDSVDCVIHQHVKTFLQDILGNLQTESQLKDGTEGKILDAVVDLTLSPQSEVQGILNTQGLSHYVTSEVRHQGLMDGGFNSAFVTGIYISRIPTIHCKFAPRKFC